MQIEWNCQKREYPSFEGRRKWKQCLTETHTLMGQSVWVIVCIALGKTRYAENPNPKYCYWKIGL